MIWDIFPPISLPDNVRVSSAAAPAFRLASIISIKNHASHSCSQRPMIHILDSFFYVVTSPLETRQGFISRTQSMATHMYRINP